MPASRLGPKRKKHIEIPSCSRRVVENLSPSPTYKLPVHLWSSQPAASCFSRDAKATRGAEVSCLSSIPVAGQKGETTGQDSKGWRRRPRMPTLHDHTTHVFRGTFHSGHGKEIGKQTTCKDTRRENGEKTSEGRGHGFPKHQLFSHMASYVTPFATLRPRLREEYRIQGDENSFRKEGVQELETSRNTARTDDRDREGVEWPEADPTSALIRPGGRGDNYEAADQLHFPTLVSLVFNVPQVRGRSVFRASDLDDPSGTTLDPGENGKC